LGLSECGGVVRNSIVLKETTYNIFLWHFNPIFSKSNEKF
jgi:hypothetical protein